MNERRTFRMQQVLGHRLSRVRCAIEAVHHRHNVSAILRTCDALGVYRVHLVGAPGMRVSRGPARGAERWLDVRHHPDAEHAIAELRAEGVRIWVADIADGAVMPESVPVDAPVCLWFGAELMGVSAAANAAADGVITIPMLGMAQSLNVSVAAAMALRPVADRARALGPPALLASDEAANVFAAWQERDRATALRIVEGDQ